MKAIVLAVAMILPIILSNYLLQDVSIGFSVALGVLLSSPSDVPGSVKHNFYGILIAIVLVVSLTIVFGFAMNYFWILLPLLGISVFLISYLSVFGFRASLISFSGLMAIVLSFANDYHVIGVFQHAGLIGIGGLWYLFLFLLRSFLFPKAQTDFFFYEATEKTAEFLRIRSKLLLCNTDRNELYKELFHLQIEITELHEIIRALILKNRKESEFSNRLRRQQLFFSELVDVLELAISNPVDYEKFDVVFKDHPEKVEMFKDLLLEMANQLEHISKAIRKEEKLQLEDTLETQLLNISKEIDNYKISVGLPKSRIGTLMLLNFKKYQEKQVQNITGLKRVFGNYSYNDKIVNHRDSERFITPQDYDLKKLRENFSLKSPIFRHSLRLTVVFLVGFLVGIFFKMQNHYWILLTIVVIMRPSYGLTKERSKNRVIGTLIGAAIATIIILLTQNTIIYAVISIVSLPIAFSIMQQNYRNGAIFITLNVIFVFAILEPNILEVIKFRIIDTVIGALLAFSAINYLFPSWEFQNVGEFISQAINSNKKFLQQIAEYYHKKGEVPTTYKLSRKEAFLSVGNLNAAFERMNQDPKSKQKDVAVIYELIVVNNTFLTSLSSLGTFIRHNKTSEVPFHFDVFIENIVLNLEQSVELIEEREEEHSNPSNIHKAKDLYKNSFEDLANKRDEEIAQGIEVSVETVDQLKETHLVSEQVKWLFNLSEKMVVGIKSYK